MRGSPSFCALIATVVFAAGCSTTSWTWRKPTTPAVAGKKQTDSTAEKTADADEKQHSPFVAEREKSAAKAGHKSAETPKPADKPAAKDAANPNALAFSPETLKLIHDELRDATPEERTQWHEQLKRVEPGVIPEILRARRMSLQVAQKTASPAAADSQQNAWTNPGKLSAPATPADRVQSAGYSPASGATSVTSAGYQAPADARSTVDQALHQGDSRSGNPAVATPGYAADPQTGRDASAAQVPIAVQRQAPTQEVRTVAYSEPAAPTVPWPPQKVPPSAPPRSNLAPPLAFGAGLVQNVVGLVPNRNASQANNAPNNAIQPAIQTFAGNDWHAELNRSIAQLEQEIAAQKPGPLSEDEVQKHVALRLMYLLADHQERALTAIPGLDPAEQEFWQQAIWGLSNSLDVRHIPRAEDRATQTIAQLGTAVRRLQEKADLQIRNVAFSKQNFGYGNYDRFVQNEVRPGQEVLLYAEIENFKSEPTADGQYRTLLRSTIEVLSPSGEVRKKIDFPATEDLCRNYRRDYFHNYQFTVPDRLPLGPHVLKLAVFDELSGKMATYTLNFLVN